jgi:hypothetical protein
MATAELVPVQHASGVLMSAETIERVLLQGDLQALAPHQRLEYYKGLCQSLDLNPLTKPFEYLLLDKKLVLYAKKDCTEQLRAKRTISIKIVSREVVADVYVVTAHASTPESRTDEAIGAVPLVKENGSWKSGSEGKRFFQGDGTYSQLSPPDRANAMMKAETKAKRRVTLSICGLGLLDESELDTVGNARRISAEDAHTVETFHQQNTKEQQAALAQERIAQERAKITHSRRAEVAETGSLPNGETGVGHDSPGTIREIPATSTRGPEFTGSIADFCQRAAKAKELIGDKEYYRVLGNAGYEHANEVRNTDHMQKILADWRACPRVVKPTDPPELAALIARMTDQDSSREVIAHVSELFYNCVPNAGDQMNAVVAQYDLNRGRWSKELAKRCQDAVRDIWTRIQASQPKRDIPPVTEDDIPFRERLFDEPAHRDD